MKKQLVSIVVLFCLMIGCSGCLFFDELPGEEVKELIEETYSINTDKSIVISTINGEITISSWNNESIHLSATKRSRYGYDDLDNARIIVSETEDEFSISIQNKQPTNNRAVDLVIKIPSTVSLSSVTSTNGNIHLSNTKGNTSISTINGLIIAEKIDGFVSATSTNGVINVIGSKGIDELITSNAEITAELFELRSDVQIQSTNGDIVLYTTPYLNASVDLSTTNGKISVNETIVSVSESTLTHVTGLIGSKEHSLDVLTVNGDISIMKIIEIIDGKV